MFPKGVARTYRPALVCTYSTTPNRPGDDMIHTPALHDVGTDVFVVDENDDYYAATVIGVTAGVHRWVRGIYGDELVPLSSLRDYTWAGLA